MAFGVETYIHEQVKNTPNQTHILYKSFRCSRRTFTTSRRSAIPNIVETPPRSVDTGTLGRSNMYDIGLRTTIIK